MNTDNCQWTWYAAENTEFSGVAGYKVTSKKTGYTDKFIFGPAAGYCQEEELYYAGLYGFYWSSSLSTIYSGYAWYLSFGMDGRNVGEDYDRFYGHSVRAVCP